MPKPIVVRVCNESSCAKKGSGRIMEVVEKITGLDLGYGPCVGCCEFGPNLEVNGNLIIGANTHTVAEEINKAAQLVAPTLEQKKAALDKVLAEDILGDLI